MTLELYCLAAYLVGRRDELTRVEKMLLLEAEKAAAVPEKKKSGQADLLRKPAATADLKSAADSVHRRRTAVAA